jgi:hypothetical protein
MEEQVELFQGYSFSGKIGDLRKKVNEWLTETKDIEVIERLMSSGSDNKVVIAIFYKKI